MNPKTELSSGASLIGDASAEWAEKGELTPETMAKFSEMSSQDLVNAYIEMQANAPEQLMQQEAVALTCLMQKSTPSKTLLVVTRHTNR